MNYGALCTHERDTRSISDVFTVWVIKRVEVKQMLKYHTNRLKVPVEL